MKKAIFPLIVFITMTSLITAQEKMEIEGAVILSNSEDSDPKPGTIRWTGLNFEGWNGFTWITLTTFRVNNVIRDIENNEYHTVIIGDQEWMAENLRTSQYRNGEDILNVQNDMDWISLGAGAFCWYNNDNSLDNVFGKLYNWYAVMDDKGICPIGWHVPDDTEWKNLIDNLGNSSIVGGSMKESNGTLWNFPNKGATNSSGFTALPGGARGTTGAFQNIGESGFWWTSSEVAMSTGILRTITFDESYIVSLINSKTLGLSVRCIKD